MSHSQWPSEQISFITIIRLPILQLPCRLFWQNIASPSSVSPATAQIWLPATFGFSQIYNQNIASPSSVSPPPQPKFGSLRLLAFPKSTIAVEREVICKCDSHTVHKLSQRRLTADWLAPREIDCSRKHSKVFSGWLPSYVKAKRPVLEVFKMVGYSPNSPRTSKTRPQGTVESSHFGRCARISEGTNVGLKYKIVMGNNITCTVIVNTE